MCDSNTNLKEELSCVKSSKSRIEKDFRKLDKKIKKLEVSKLQHSVSTQTNSTNDIPYSLDDPLPPPIFRSNLCHKTKPVFLSYSVPDLSKVLWVTKTKDDVLQECAEEALSTIYDREVASFYL